jgi:hypothetical protein
VDAPEALSKLVPA